MSDTSLSKKEIRLIDNIINKLQIQMEKNNQSLYSMSVSLGFNYQPVYKLMKGRRIPDMSSLAILSDRLDCSLEDLISNKVPVEVGSINIIEEITNPIVSKKSKIYIPAIDYIPNAHNEFFIIKNHEIPAINGIRYVKIYFKISQITTDGIFIVKYQGKISQLNIVSISSKFIVVEDDTKETKILQEEIQPLAKFFDDCIVFDNSKNYVYGVDL